MAHEGAVTLAYAVRPRVVGKYLGRLCGTLDDRELQALVLIIVVNTLALWVCLAMDARFSLAEALVQATAMTVSAQTTAGFSTVNVGELASSAKGWLILSMPTGGCMRVPLPAASNCYAC